MGGRPRACQQLGFLLGLLTAQPDSVEAQNLLYDSAVFCSSDISDGNRHHHDDMPVVLGGHGGGRLKPGQPLRYASGNGAPKQKVSDLLVTMLVAAGVPGGVGD
jgi:hypothetical protein